MIVVRNLNIKIVKDFILIQKIYTNNQMLEYERPNR